MGFFFMFFKLYEWYQIAQNITYARAISSINIFILCSNVQHVFSKYVTTVQSNWIIFFQESLEICAFFKCVGVHIYKNHQSTWRWFKGWKNQKFSCISFCVCFFETSGATRALQRNVHLLILFIKNHKSWTKQIMYLK